MGGHVPLIDAVDMPAGQHAPHGRQTPLAETSEKRSPVEPNVPTVVELGMSDLVSAVFFGIVAPAGVPRPVVDRLNGLLRQIIKDPEVEKKFIEMGYVTTGSTPEAYAAKLKFETERWTKVVKDNGIKVES